MFLASEIYLAAIDRVVSRVRAWSATDGTVAIPACPGWTAHDLIAHLAGGAADHAAGRLDGFPGPAWTSRHIAERADRTDRELLIELTALAPQTATRCDLRAGAPNSSWDAYIHERDLAAAFRQEPVALDEHGHQLLNELGAFLCSDEPFRLAMTRADDLVEVTVTAGSDHVATVEAVSAFATMTGRGGPAAANRWHWHPTAPPARILRQLSLF